MNPSHEQNATVQRIIDPRLFRRLGGHVMILMFAERLCRYQCRRERQRQRKPSTAVGIVYSAQRAAMQCSHGGRNSKTEPRSLCLRCYKRIEDVTEHV